MTDYSNKVLSKKKDELNHVRKEEFTFCSILTLHNMVLKVKVLDNDFISNDKIGSYKIKLEDIDFTSGKLYESIWVIDHNGFSKDTEIFLTLIWTED